MMIRCMVYTFIWLPTMIQNYDKIYNYKILHLILQYHHSDFEFTLGVNSLNQWFVTCFGY